MLTHENANAQTLPGFENATLQSQTAFRAIMKALSEPAQPVDAPELVNAPAPVNAAAAMVLLTLCDVDTVLWLEPQAAGSTALREFLSFHTGTKFTENPAEAEFALVSDLDRLPQLSDFAQGTDTFPDRSTTLIVQVHGFYSSGHTFSGPGLKTPVELGVANITSDFWSQWVRNTHQYPRGVDLILCTPTQIAGLPRTSKIAGGI